LTAVKEFFKKAESMNLLNALNKAYSTEETAEEKTLKRKGKAHYFKKIITVNKKHTLISRNYSGRKVRRLAQSRKARKELQNRRSSEVWYF